MQIYLQIKAGTFDKPAPVSDMTMRQLMDAYLERVVVPDHPTTAQAYRCAFNTMAGTEIPSPMGGRRPLGAWRVADVVTDTVLRFREERRKRTGVVGVNRHLGLLRVLFNWGTVAGYRDGGTPFQRGSTTVVKLAREPPRSRRLQDGEEQSLLAQCGSHLKAIVMAAIDSGMRRGEILSLQWSQVEGMTLVEKKGQWSIIVPLQTQVRANFRLARLMARLTSIYGLLALALAALGLYGVTAYGVSQRTREIGVRMALGADRWRVVGTCVKGPLVQTCVGLVIGLLGASLAGQALSTQLYGVGRLDPKVFAGATLGLIFAACLAAALPARRAASVNPAAALRGE